jgi:uncharacterized membrane protein (UPF0127 family)
VKQNTILVSLVVIVAIISISLIIFFLRSPEVDNESTVHSEPVVLDQNEEAMVTTTPSDHTEVFGTIEIADSGEERRQGLQFRESLCDDCAMLFVFEQQNRVSFWMQNTSIPLDMIFIDDQGIIQKIHRNTIPFQTTPQYSNELPDSSNFCTLI